MIPPITAMCISHKEKLLQYWNFVIPYYIAYRFRVCVSHLINKGVYVLNQFGKIEHGN